MDLVGFVGGAYLLFAESIRQAMTRPRYPRLIVDQMYYIGVKSLILVFATNFSTGMVMAIQFGFGLEQFGGKLYVPKLVSLSIVRELGPVFTSLMLAARVSAGIASEVGSMAVTQQIDAIRALGTSPIKKIVIPRIAATFLCLPLLTVMANVVGIFGAMLASASELGISPDFFLQKTADTVTSNDFIVGMVKVPFFALFISVPACFYGMTTRDGTQGVGIATTKAVVVSSILIVIGDFFLTKMAWMVLKWMS